MSARTVPLSISLAALRERFGLTAEQLPDNATDEQIQKLFAAPTTPATPPAAVVPPEPTREDEPVVQSVRDVLASGAVDPRLHGGMIVDAEMWANTQTELAVVREDREKRQHKEDVDFLAAACRKGKLPPSRVDHYMKLMKADREGTVAFIDDLPEALPIHEYGSMGDMDEVMKASEYPEIWLAPGERRRISLARAAYSEGRIGDVEPGSIIREA